METKKITLSAMLSALFVVISLTIMGTGIAYTLYLDMMVPIIIAIIFQVCDIKYTILSVMTSLFIIILVLGDFAAGIWMIQSMIIGLVCGRFVSKDSNMQDDLVKCAMFSSMVMLIMDLYFSGFLGYSFLKDFKETVDMMPMNGIIRDVAFYVMVAALPAGTTMLTYYATILLGKKFKVLNNHAMRKYNALIRSKKYSPYYCCSNWIVYGCTVIIAGVFIIEYFNISIGNAYIKAMITTMEYVALFVVIKDGVMFIRRFLFIKTKQSLLDVVITLSMVFGLVKKFKITVIVIAIFNLVISITTKIREEQLNFVYEATAVEK